MITANELISLKAFAAQWFPLSESRSWILYIILCIWDAWMHWTCFSFYVYALFNMHQQPPQQKTTLSPNCMPFSQGHGEWKLLISFNESLYEKYFHHQFLSDFSDEELWLQKYFFPPRKLLCQAIFSIWWRGLIITWNSYSEKGWTSLEILKPHRCLNIFMPTWSWSGFIMEN